MNHCSCISKETDFPIERIKMAFGSTTVSKKAACKYHNRPYIIVLLCFFQRSKRSGLNVWYYWSFFANIEENWRKVPSRIIVSLCSHMIVCPIARCMLSQLCMDVAGRPCMLTDLWNKSFVCGCFTSFLFFVLDSAEKLIVLIVDLQK